MRRTHPISIYADPATKAQLQAWAGERRMNLSDYCMHLIAKGLAADEMTKGVERLREAYTAPALDAVLRELLAIRYVVEHHAKGDIRFPATLGSDANTYADKALGTRQTPRKEIQP
ncbi:hypothetical protein IGB42_04298 [Andreprevotia sp. IGB-42]|uniref:hypothetical protein n=1 Tax=Andreprevotia sp. IGB-42 TaxID=2497473 RepID=UPI00135A30E9|nr:hypothetical protein [Andreprevotia sp. IGB-42]KAF0811240.1 hypothetical protein IGB42_04298 [Andreprevotia sp. IGB-42]